MKSTKLNKNWSAEPATPEPEIAKTDTDIELTFFLNPDSFEHVSKDDQGKLVFSNVYAYRLGEADEVEFANGQLKYTGKQLPWGDFYELTGSDWNTHFPDDAVFMNESIAKNKLRHFIFFLKDIPFECIATDYEFSFIDTISDLMDEKYPKGYFHHYLAMFASQFDKPSKENYEIYTDLYIQMEGKKEFADLKLELKKIQSNGDPEAYVKIANYMGIPNFGKAQLLEMFKVIENYK